MGLPESLSQYWLKIQRSLFPHLEEELGELTEKQGQLLILSCYNQYHCTSRIQERRIENGHF